MLRIFHNPNYDFLRWWRWAAGLTIAFIAMGLATFAFTGGVNYSIEFTGGTLMQVEFKQPPDVAVVRSTLERAGITGAEIQQFGTNREYTIRAQDRVHVEAQEAGAEGVSRRIEQALQQQFGEDSFTVVFSEAVGPRVGDELRRGALIAILLGSLVTLVYLAIRFEWRFGVSAVLSTMHDILVTMAFIKMFDIEVSLTVVAAILTLLGYSMNDTIIIFDRVRENLKKQRKEPLPAVLNRSINETLPRSVLTHATTLASSLALLIFAGDVLRPFAWVMTFGVVVATFSSMFVASPLLLYIERRWPRPTQKSGGSRTSAAERPAPARGRREEPVATR